MTESAAPPPPPRPMQFDVAERVEGPATAPTCATCGTTIASTYFERGGAIVCPDCRERMLAARELGTSLSRFGRAALFGGGAAVAGALLWYGVSKLTGYQFSLIAIVIGYGVGWAVRFGSFGRGGWRYQALAIFLTYTAIVSTYLPAIAEAMEGAAPAASVATDGPIADADPGQVLQGDDPSAAAPDAVPDTVPDTPASTASVSGANAAAPAEDALADVGCLGFLVGVLMLAGILYAAPFLAGFENFIGWIILAFGVYEAWKLNRAETLLFEGPFRIAVAGATDGSGTGSGAAPSPPPPAPPPPIAP